MMKMSMRPQYIELFHSSIENSVLWYARNSGFNKSGLLMMMMKARVYNSWYMA